MKGWKITATLNISEQDITEISDSCGLAKVKITKALRINRYS